MDYYTIIGLEIHVQPKTKTKLFCSCSTQYSSEPNTNVCPICLGMPGAMPYLNEEALKKAILIGLSLNCNISPKAVWDRKHYIYPDLFNGYQISQLTDPVNIKGYVDIDTPNGKKTIAINRAHLENDAAKSIHNTTQTFIDGNESGMPLVEIVTEPDLRSASDAVIFAKKVKEIIRWSGASDCDMEKGQMRFDINISIGLGNGQHTPIAEIKNRNSFTELEDVIEFETLRQIEDYEKNHVVYSHGKKTTRGWNSDTKQSFLMRTKEEANDYRYFPEPDIPTLYIPQQLIEEVKSSMKPPKNDYIDKLKKLGLSQKQIDSLLDDPEKTQLFEETSKMLPKLSELKIVNWILGDLSYMLNLLNINLSSSKLDILKFGKLIALVESKAISNTNAKIILESLLTHDIPNFEDYLKPYMNESNQDGLEESIEKVINSNPQVIDQIKNGKESAKQFLVGMVMKEMKGKADPLNIKKILDERIK